MQRLVLHGYPESPFAEKIRCILGYTGLAYESVKIPVIMPKPDLTALTGGYRRTPTLQIDADIYCDTALIARVIDDIPGHDRIHGGPRSVHDLATARWFDSVLFRCCVGLVFQPQVLASNERFRDPAVAQAFVKDRAALVGNGGSVAEPAERAAATVRETLAAADAQLGGDAFLGGSRPGIADFSLWHCYWFISSQPLLCEYVEPHSALSRWGERMQAFSEAGKAQPLSGGDAVARAAAAEPVTLADATIDTLTGLTQGQEVEVLPTDYGRQAVRGILQRVDDQAISLLREDSRAGRLQVHFPRYGFEVRAASATTESGE